MAKIRTRHLDRARAEDGRDKFVDDEGVIGGDDLIPAIEKSVPEELENFVGASAENELVAVDV